MIKRLGVNLLAFEFGGYLAQVKCGARQPVHAGHNEGITFPDILRAGILFRPFVRGVALFLLEDFVAAL